MGVKHMDVKEAYRLQAGDGYAYIDVRSIPEYDGGHPAGAHNVPLLHDDAQTGQQTPNPEFLAVIQATYSHGGKLLIGCQVGGRSTQAAQLLTAHGYQHAANVRGGFGGARDPATGELVAEGCRWPDCRSRRQPRRAGATRSCARTSPNPAAPSG